MAEFHCPTGCGHTTLKPGELCPHCWLDQSVGHADFEGIDRYHAIPAYTPWQKFDWWCHRLGSSTTVRRVGLAISLLCTFGAIYTLVDAVRILSP